MVSSPAGTKSLVDELGIIANKLQPIRERAGLPEVCDPLDALESAAQVIGKSWSGSWLGYHSRVYYAGLKPPPPGASFSIEWGLMDLQTSSGTRGDWDEFAPETITNAVHKLAKNPDLSAAKALAKDASDTFDSLLPEAVSLLSIAEKTHTDQVITDLAERLRKLKPSTYQNIIRAMQPQGQVISRDSHAITSGYQVPPHIDVMAEVFHIRQFWKNCERLDDIVTRASSHLRRVERIMQPEKTKGGKVFIGHGNSPAWKELKDFVNDRLRLPWDEFNRVSVAGISTTERLAQMLNEAAFALLVLTGEDESKDGTIHARQNVIHEAGLFQGRLGFKRAIVLLEQGCEEFSNIHGLGQIRFQSGNMAAKFEEIRQVFEREGML